MKVTSKSVSRRRKPDKYDRAIAYLRNHPEEIHAAWDTAACRKNARAKGWELFTVCSEYDDGSYGCLTQVRAGEEAYTDKLTNAIRADTRLPATSNGITVKSLPLFARWQRRIDKELGRKP